MLQEQFIRSSLKAMRTLLIKVNHSRGYRKLLPLVSQTSGWRSQTASIYPAGLQVFLMYVGYGFFVGFSCMHILSSPFTPVNSLWPPPAILPIGHPFPATDFFSWAALPDTRPPQGSTLTPIDVWNVLTQRSTWISSPASSRLCSVVTFSVKVIRGSTYLVFNIPYTPWLSLLPIT